MHLHRMEIDIPKAKPLTIEFRTKSNAETKLSIDREGRTIDDVLLIRTGEADGHGFSVEASFLSDMSKYIRKEMGGRVQCNMGHRWDALYFQLGRFDGGKVSADGTEFRAQLSVYKAADKSPAMKDMAEWFMDLAEEDPQAVMCSIKFESAGFYQYDDKGVKVYVQSNWWSGPEKQFKNKPVFVEFARLFSCDIVDQGALTDSLMSNDGQNNVARALAEIHDAPNFLEFMRENEDHFPKLQAFFGDKYQFSLAKLFPSIFKSKSMDPKETPAPAATTQKEDVTTSPELKSLSDQFTEFKKTMTEEITGLKSQIKTKDDRIAELEKKPVGTVTEFASEDEAPSTGGANGREFENHPMNVKARKMAAAQTVK
ncbi:MAG TPA: hypothetical protein VFG10_18950 [Saprospiraceae bacterium]|nr:hypothetical protein [Saprospiraceae bacterium]